MVYEEGCRNRSKICANRLFVPFVHCASHNLNLIINDAVESVAQNQKFFSIMQDIFNFFGKSLNG